MAESTLVNIVNQSPIAVKARSLQSWLNAFSTSASVEDPNGSYTHVGHDNLTVFNSALIAPHNISFDTQQDFVDESFQRVTRITDIHICFFANKWDLGEIQPSHLVYDVDRTTHKVLKLRANWQLSQARWKGNNPISKLVSLILFSGGIYPLVSHFGVVWTIRYLSTFLLGPLFSGGKELGHRLMKTVSDQDEAGFVRCFTPDALVEFGGKTVSPQTLWTQLFHKSSRMSLHPKGGRLITSAFRTAGWYQRGPFQGVFHFESRKPTLFSCGQISSLYVFEKDA